jgi:chemotaxis response regulator CheB
MKTARVLLANQSSLRRERLLAAISNQPDIEIVGELEDGCDIQMAVARLRPDWVVVTHGESPGSLAPVLRNSGGISANEDHEYPFVQE